VLHFNNPFSSYKGNQVKASNKRKSSLIALPIPIWIIVNLKKGYGGRTIDATIKPMIDPTIELKTTFMGINHLQNNEISINWCLHIIEIGFYKLFSKLN